MRTDFYKDIYQEDEDSIRLRVESDTNRESHALNKLRTAIKNKRTDDANKVIIDLIAVCKQNDFVQKIALGSLFDKLVSYPNFDTYSNRFAKIIYLDTAPLLYLLCAFLPKGHTVSK